MLHPCLRSVFRCALAALAAAFCLAAAEHHGQVRFGGLPLPGATVTAVHGETKLATTTGPDGLYSFPELADGLWTVRVEMLCFDPAERQVSVAPADDAAAEWDLELLPLERLEAMATAAPLEAVATAAPATALKPAQQRPAPAKDAVEPPPDDPTGGASDGFLINGSVNNGAATPFGQSGAFGNARGARGPRLNGNAALILGNSALDARPYSLSGQDTPKPAYGHLEGLLSLGGPLVIPHLFDRNSAPQFFASYQRSANSNATTQTALVPTAAERAGDFSQTRDALGRPVRPLDPTNGAPFPDAAIPAARISPQARTLLALYPMPNFAGGGRYNYQVPLSAATHQDDVQARIDKFLGGRNSVSGNLAYRSTRTDNPNLFGFLDTGAASGINTGANWMHRLGKRGFATLRFEFSRMSERNTPYFVNRENVSGLAGIAGNNQDPLNWGPPSLVFSSGIAGLSDGLQSFARNQTSALSLDASWMRSPHNLKFGGVFRRQQFNLLSQQDPRGTFTFTGASAGYDFAGFLLGIPDTAAVAFGNADKYLRQSAAALYLTDDWRIGPSLSATVGLRWEYEAPLTERYGRMVNLAIAPGFTSASPAVARDSGLVMTPDRRGFEPRLGVAWRPRAASSLVVRAGYGVYRNTSVYQQIAMRMLQQSPLSKTLSIANTAANPLTLAAGFEAPAPAVPNTFAVDPHFRVGYSQAWQLSIQRDLPASLVMIATYSGSKGNREVQQFLPNTYPEGAQNPCPACPSGFIYMASNGNSTRQAAQLQLRRRLHNGFTAELQYTLAKAIDDAALGGRGQGVPVIAQNWLDLGAERAVSSFDQRHQLSAQFQYTSGMGIGGGGLLGGTRGRLLKSWTVAAQLTAASGLPLTPVYPAAVVGTGVTGPLRPDSTGLDVYDAPPGFHLNPAAYAAPAAGRWGNAGRNSIAGPPQLALNASLGRTFLVKDHYNAGLRLEATNALNHVTYTGWNTTIQSAQFGLPSSANAMRKLQASLRVRF